MKKSFWKVSALACAAVVSACAVTASASVANRNRCVDERAKKNSTMTDDEFFEAEERRHAEWDANHTVAPYMIETTESGLTVYEEALLAGDYSLGCGIVKCDHDHVHWSSSYSEEDRLKAIDKSGTQYALTKSENASYPLWVGRFTCSEDLNTYKWYSISPSCFEISGAGRKITMHSLDKYSTLYKKVSVRLTYLKNGKITYVTTPAVGDTTQDIVVNAKSGDGELVEIAAFFYIYDASSESTGFREVAMVHILHQNYVPTAVENNEPYAHLIDEYTLV